MSAGLAGYMNLISSDETTLVYSYCCYNINNEHWKEDKSNNDGKIIIHRNAFVEPEIHSTVKRLPNGKKKLITKRIRNDFSLEDLFLSKMITIDNASGTWKTDVAGVDIMALKLIFKLFNVYQDTGVIPDSVSWFS